jgi:quinol-cytochrome oxidoreductase complex cytochrome b subunit/mono/diheme cytochrome c family protein
LLRTLSDWLDSRTGYRKLRDALLIEHIPGGAKWRYVWGSCLAFVFMIQLITGILLMTAYSPGDSTAWGSVYFIQYEMDFGWLVRGLHHFGSEAMVVLLGLHMLQVVIAGAHLPPREVNWWLGLVLMGLVLGLSLTGYLLPWDQKGYWATRVATNIMGFLPIIGPFLQRIVVGGPDYGHQTLTHFYALHTGIIPPLLILVLVAHLAVFRRHGVTAPARAEGEGWFWPEQAFKDLIGSLIIFGILLGIVVFGGHGNSIDEPFTPGQEPGLYEKAAKAGRYGLGANLDAPADPQTPSYPARPEWYFLFLFQLLKYFEGENEIIGAVIIPGAVGLVLFLLPLFGPGPLRKAGHFLGVLIVMSLLASVVFLTFLAIVDDSPKTILGFEPRSVEEARKHVEDTAEAEVLARRAVNLAFANVPDEGGIPEEGARELLRKDPKTRGKELFKTNCTVCHKFTLPEPTDGFKGFIEGQFKAADLGRFGTASWVRGLLENPSDAAYFGHTKLQGMKNWRKKIDNLRAEWKKKESADVYAKKVAAQNDDFDLLANFLAEQSKPRAARDPELIKRGLEVFFDKKRPGYCAGCHHVAGFKRDGGSEGPELTDYASADWIRLMIMAPSNPRRHGANNQMPAFRPLQGVGSEVHLIEFKDANPNTAVIDLSDIDRELIIRFMTRDDRVVFGGRIISGPKQRKR